MKLSLVVISNQDFRRKKILVTVEEGNSKAKIGVLENMIKVHKRRKDMLNLINCYVKLEAIVLFAESRQPVLIKTPVSQILNSCLSPTVCTLATW